MYLTDYYSINKEIPIPCVDKVSRDRSLVSINSSVADRSCHRLAQVKQLTAKRIKEFYDKEKITIFTHDEYEISLTAQL